jgi:hypothetical protein
MDGVLMRRFFPIAVVVTAVVFIAVPSAQASNFCTKKYVTKDGLVRYLGGINVSCTKARQVARYWLRHDRAPRGWRLRYTDGNPNVVASRGTRGVYWDLADGL